MPRTTLADICCRVIEFDDTISGSIPTELGQMNALKVL